MNPWKKYVAEAIGTCALILFGPGAVVVNAETGGMLGHFGISVSFGLVVMGVIYALGPISGAHINPAVSFGFWVSGQLTRLEFLAYSLFQFLGAALGGLLLLALFPGAETYGQTLPSESILQSFVLEAVLTYFLMLVIIGMVEGPRHSISLIGLVVGGTVGLAALFGGPITGASMNPARSLGPALVSGEWTALWLYFAAPLLGAGLAIGNWKLIKPTPLKN